jgi:hypothetical protein
MKQAVFVVLLLLVASVASARVGPAPHEEAAERARVTALVRRARAGAAAYKRTEPIIGVLTQPCSDCPGR